MNSEAHPMKPMFFGACAPGTGPDLTGYPTLTYAPLEYGEGVRVASSGAPIESVAGDARVNGLVDSIDSFARTAGLTWDELIDSLRYARKHGAL